MLKLTRGAFQILDEPVARILAPAHQGSALAQETNASQVVCGDGRDTELFRAFELMDAESCRERVDVKHVGTPTIQVVPQNFTPPCGDASLGLVARRLRRRWVAKNRYALVFGKLGDAHVVVVQGRIHLYEGYGPESVIFPVQLVNHLGAQSLIVTNAAGGISPFLHPGCLMWITDHIDWTFSERRARLSGGSENGRSRVRSVPEYYDLNWMKQVEQRALDEGIQTFSGTYLWTRGPSYETKAEIRAFHKLGADAVGMSTVPEVVEATRLNMTVAGISTITNYAAGISDQKLDHSEVIEVGLRVKKDLERLVMLLIESTPV